MTLNIMESDLYDLIDAVVKDDRDKGRNALMSSGLRYNEATSVFRECADNRADMCESCTLLDSRNQKLHDLKEDHEAEITGLNLRIDEILGEKADLQSTIDILKGSKL